MPSPIFQVILVMAHVASACWIFHLILIPEKQVGSSSSSSSTNHFQCLLGLRTFQFSCPSDYSDPDFHLRDYFDCQICMILAGLRSELTKKTWSLPSIIMVLQLFLSSDPHFFVFLQSSVRFYPILPKIRVLFAVNPTFRYQPICRSNSSFLDRNLANISCFSIIFR